MTQSEEITPTKQDPIEKEEMIEVGALDEFISFLRDIVIILLIVLFIRWIIITPFRINGSSMETSYHDKEYILVDKFSYFDMRYIFYAPRGDGGVDDIIGNVFASTLGKIPMKIGEPKRGDVIVLTPHVDKSREYYIKRIIAMPGDTIQLKNGDVFIKKGSTEKFIKIEENYLSVSNAGQTFLPPYVDTDIFTVPEGMYWVMGDNRTNSADSRACFRTCTSETDITAHFIKRGDILGKVLVSFGYFNIFKDRPNSIIPGIGDFSWVHPPRLLDHPRNANYGELGE